MHGMVSLNHEGYKLVELRYVFVERSMKIVIVVRDANKNNYLKFFQYFLYFFFVHNKINFWLKKKNIYFVLYTIFPKDKHTLLYKNKLFSKTHPASYALMVESTIFDKHLNSFIENLFPLMISELNIYDYK